MPNFINQLSTPRQMVPSLGDEIDRNFQIGKSGFEFGNPFPLTKNEQPQSFQQPVSSVGASPKIAITDSTGDKIIAPVEQPWRKASGQAAKQYAPEDYEG